MNSYVLNSSVLMTTSSHSSHISGVLCWHHHRRLDWNVPTAVDQAERTTIMPILSHDRGTQVMILITNNAHNIHCYRMFDGDFCSLGLPYSFPLLFLLSFPHHTTLNSLRGLHQRLPAQLCLIRSLSNDLHFTRWARNSHKSPSWFSSLSFSPALHWLLVQQLACGFAS